MSEDKRPDILKPVVPDESIFCANCGHSIRLHDSNRIPVCSYDATSELEKGRYECPCTGFVAQPDSGV